jgi:hypothetical protein
MSKTVEYLMKKNLTTPNLSQRKGVRTQKYDLKQKSPLWGFRGQGVKM